MDYAPYQPDAVCPKCLYPTVTTEYYPNGLHPNCGDLGNAFFYRQQTKDPVEFNNHWGRCASWPEHIDRRCVRCAHVWTEASATSRVVTHRP